MKKIIKIALVLAILVSSNIMSVAQEMRPEYSDLIFKRVDCDRPGTCANRQYFELKDGTVLFVRSFYSTNDYIRIASFDKNFKAIADEKVEVKNLSLYSSIRVYKIEGDAYVRYKYEDRTSKSEKLVFRKINPSDVSLGEEITLAQISLDEKKNGGKINEGFGHRYINIMTSDKVIKVYQLNEGLEMTHKKDINLSGKSFKDYYLNVYPSVEGNDALKYELTLYNKEGTKTKTLYDDSDESEEVVSTSNSVDLLPGYSAGGEICMSETNKGLKLMGYVVSQGEDKQMLTGVVLDKDSDEPENIYTHELDIEWIWENVSGKWKSSYEKARKKGKSMPLGLKMKVLSLNTDMSMTFVLNMNYGKIVLINVDKGGELNWRTVINKFDEADIELYGYNPMGLKGFLKIETKEIGDGRVALAFNVLDGFKVITVDEQGEITENMVFKYAKNDDHIFVGSIYNGDFLDNDSDYWYFMNILKSKSGLIRVKIPD